MDGRHPQWACEQSWPALACTPVVASQGALSKKRELSLAGSPCRHRGAYRERRQRRRRHISRRWMCISAFETSQRSPPAGDTPRSGADVLARHRRRTSIETHHESLFCVFSRAGGQATHMRALSRLLRVACGSRAAGRQVQSRWRGPLMAPTPTFLVRRSASKE